MQKKRRRKSHAWAPLSPENPFQHWQPVSMKLFSFFASCEETKKPTATTWAI
jgi:hypothetical protein